MGNLKDWAACLISILLFCCQIEAFTESHYGYKEGELLMVMFNSLTSDKSILPLSSTIFPLCSSKSIEIKGSPMNVGQILMGDNMQSSPFHVKMNINESFVHICDSDPLSASQIELYKKVIDENYHINMFLDGLPAMSPEPVLFRKPWTGSPVGFPESLSYHVFNHLKLRILVRESNTFPKVFAIVGFVADPCPCCHEVWPFVGPHIYALHRLPVSCNGVPVTRELRENETIRFSYEVAFEKSNRTWEHRWDRYVDKKSSTNIWFSVADCLFLFFGSFGGRIRRRRRVIAHLKEKDEERGNIMDSEMRNRNDDDHDPPFPMALSVLIGSGMQVLCTMCSTLFIGWLGFLSSSSRGSFLTQMIYCYAASAIAAGYTSVRVLKRIDTRNAVEWRGVTWRVACIFPAISAVGSVTLNTIHVGMMSAVLLKKLVLVWSCINVPLAFFGGYVAARSCSKGHCRLKAGTSMENSKRSFLLFGFYVFAWGYLTYSFCSSEVNHTVSRFVLGFYFTDYGYHLLAMMIVALLVGETVVLWKWRFEDPGWWACFLGPAYSALGLYFIMQQEWYALKYSNIASTLVYCGYCFLFFLNFMVAVGSVGFVGSFY